MLIFHFVLLGRGSKAVLNPADRAPPEFRQPLATAANSTQLVAIQAGANRNNVTRLAPPEAAISPIVYGCGFALQSYRSRKIGHSGIAAAACGYEELMGMRCTRLW